MQAGPNTSYGSVLPSKKHSFFFMIASKKKPDEGVYGFEGARTISHYGMKNNPPAER